MLSHKFPICCHVFNSTWVWSCFFHRFNDNYDSIKTLSFSHHFISCCLRDHSMRDVIYECSLTVNNVKVRKTEITWLTWKWWHSLKNSSCICVPCLGEFSSFRFLSLCIVYQGAASLMVTAKSSWRRHWFFGDALRHRHHHLKNRMTKSRHRR